MIELKDICKDYPLGKDDKIRVLHNINLNISQGEFVSIMGPSGSGKSTLMNIIGMLDDPSQGQYFLQKKDITNISGSEKDIIRSKNIGFVFQGYNLIKRMSVIDQVMLPLTYHGSFITNKKDRAIDALKLVGLEDKLSNHPNELSGGQQQRVAIARALVVNPLLLLCDEPTGALDTKTGNDVMELFIKLNQQGKTVVMITHDPEVAKYAQRKIVIKDGKLT